MSDVNLSYQEQQLIWIIREQSGGDDLRLQLWYGDGLWRVSMDAATGGKAVSGNGVGETFDVTDAEDVELRLNADFDATITLGTACDGSATIACAYRTSSTSRCDQT